MAAEVGSLPERTAPAFLSDDSQPPLRFDLSFSTMAVSSRELMAGSTRSARVVAGAERPLGDGGGLARGWIEIGPGRPGEKG